MSRMACGLGRPLDFIRCGSGPCGLFAEPKLLGGMHNVHASVYAPSIPIDRVNCFFFRYFLLRSTRSRTDETGRRWPPVGSLGADPSPCALCGSWAWPSPLSCVATTVRFTLSPNAFHRPFTCGHMDIENLVQMSNRIGEFFESIPGRSPEHSTRIDRLFGPMTCRWSRLRPWTNPRQQRREKPVSTAQGSAALSPVGVDRHGGRHPATCRPRRSVFT